MDGGRRTADGTRRTDIWITKSLPELSSGETKTCIIFQLILWLEGRHDLNILDTNTIGLPGLRTAFKNSSKLNQLIIFLNFGAKILQIAHPVNYSYASVT